jgi:acyl carrier protein
LATPYREAETAEQHALAQVWQSALGVEPIGVDDDFFELGGNSITAVQVIYAVSRDLKVILNSSAIFTHPTVALLASSIHGLDAGADDFVDALLDGVEEVSDEEAMRLVRELEQKGRG